MLIARNQALQLFSQLTAPHRSCSANDFSFNAVISSCAARWAGNEGWHGAEVGKCSTWTSPNYWGYSLQQIFEGDVQNPKKGTFTQPCGDCSVLFWLLIHCPMICFSHITSLLLKASMYHINPQVDIKCESWTYVSNSTHNLQWFLVSSFYKVWEVSTIASSSSVFLWDIVVVSSPESWRGKGRPLARSVAFDVADAAILRSTTLGSWPVERWTSSTKVGKRMKNLWKNPWKTLWKPYGQAMENLWKTLWKPYGQAIEKPMENPIMETLWTSYGKPYGNPMDKIWKTHGKSYGNPMDKLWTSYGKPMENPMDKLWKTHGKHMGNPMDKLWTSYGQAMENLWKTLWKPYGQAMENTWKTLWKPYGQAMENTWKNLWKPYGNLWTSYGKHMENPMETLSKT